MLTKFDHFLTHSETAAIVMRQRLKPVEGDNAVIFPPTYATVGYNIDDLGNGRNVCLIDSVGAQANRMEPIFKFPPYSELVPQITVKVKTNEAEETINLLDAGHRICDAVVRFSDLYSDINAAMKEVNRNNAMPLAKLAPTSIVFGCWDSRGEETGAKVPRIVRSIIRAYDVHKITRSAQYVPALNYSKAGILSEEEAKKGSEQGFSHVPATGTLGGVQLDDKSEIIRESVLSLSALRRLNAGTDDEKLALRRYIFGLSLIAFTAPQDGFLRMGCELTGHPDHPAMWETVYSDGKREPFVIAQKDVREYVDAAAKQFGVGECQHKAFDPKKAKESLGEKKGGKAKKTSGKASGDLLNEGTESNDE